MPCEVTTHNEQKPRATLHEMLVEIRKAVGKPAPDTKFFTRQDWIAELCETLKANEHLIDVNTQIGRDIATWWEDHQALHKEEAQRQTAANALEVTKRAAAAKLSPEERAALGLA